MSVNPPVQPPTDPCANYETNGQVDLGKLIDDATTLVACAYTEAKTLTGYFGHTVASHIGQVLVNLQRAKTVHTEAISKGIALKD